jgi:antitoxin ParD1/3/4
MNVSLHPRLAQFVEEQIAAGRFSTPEEVVNGALARLQAESELAVDDIEALRTEVAAGIDEADRGEVEPWDADEIWSEVERRGSPDGAAGNGEGP